MVDLEKPSNYYINRIIWPLIHIQQKNGQFRSVLANYIIK